jgi:chromosome segregation ATPase
MKINNYKDNTKEINKNKVNKEIKETTPTYSYYSKLLKEPFDSVEELALAEEAYYAKQKAKTEKALAKKADAQKVEDAFKALNTARKSYKEDLTQLTTEYAESLENLKKAFELGKKDIHDNLAAAEEAYSTALKAFTDKYPEGYHLTLKDGDFETTISSSSKTFTDKPPFGSDLINWLFGF